MCYFASQPHTFIDRVSFLQHPVENEHPKWWFTVKGNVMAFVFFGRKPPASCLSAPALAASHPQGSWWSLGSAFSPWIYWVTVAAQCYSPTCLDSFWQGQQWPWGIPRPFLSLWDFQLLGIHSWWSFSLPVPAPDFLVPGFPLFSSSFQDCSTYFPPLFLISPTSLLNLQLRRFCVPPTSPHGVLSLGPFISRVATLTSVNVTKSSPQALIFCKIQVHISHCPRSFHSGHYATLSSC